MKDRNFALLCIKYVKERIVRQHVIGYSMLYDEKFEPIPLQLLSWPTPENCSHTLPSAHSRLILDKG